MWLLVLIKMNDDVVICSENIIEILWSISGFHRASLLSVTFINQLMHSIITIVDVKIYIIQKYKKDTH